MAWKVYYFQTSRGDYPVKSFVEKQDLPTRTKIARSIRMLVDYGPFIKPPYCKKLHDKLWELRILGKVAIRILYTYKNDAYYLIHAFKKKSQKTPSYEVQT